LPSLNEATFYALLLPFESTPNQHPISGGMNCESPHPCVRALLPGLRIRRKLEMVKKGNIHLRAGDLRKPDEGRGLLQVAYREWHTATSCYRFFNPCSLRVFANRTNFSSTVCNVLHRVTFWNRSIIHKHT